MARLVVHPGSPSAWEINLKPGRNLVGRGAANDFTIEDASVSTSHCQIEVSPQGVFIQDLGSTNGTYVNRTPVRGSALRPGQTIHLGTVELLFASPAETSPPILAPPAPGASGGSHRCGSHPKTLARFFCHHCRHYFCELCVASRTLDGVPHKFCRGCGSECAPVQARIDRPVEIGFFARIPEAFAYPFRGGGFFMMLAGIVIFAGIKFGQLMMLFGGARGLAFGIMLQVTAGGYLFTFLQSIIYALLAGEREMPDMPAMSNFAEDILMPFLRLLGLALFCFAPAITIEIWVLMSGENSAGALVICAAVLGFIYFPMAFLAVAVLDRVLAANPLLVIPSILKVPLEYFVTLMLLGMVFVLRALGDFLLSQAIPRGMLTHSTGEMLVYLGATFFWGFMSFYLLIAGVHVLTQLYITNKARLGWLH